jgi:hypothetical protein
MSGRHDQAARRASKRKGRETGCWIYIPGEQLQRLGFVAGEPPPFYRTWDGGRQPRVLVNLYRER